jgi:hypothetical protein
MYVAVAHQRWCVIRTVWPSMTLMPRAAKARGAELRGDPPGLRRARTGRFGPRLGSDGNALFMRGATGWGTAAGSRHSFAPNVRRMRLLHDGWFGALRHHRRDPLWRSLPERGLRTRSPNPTVLEEQDCSLLKFVSDAQPDVQGAACDRPGSGAMLRE